MHKIEAERDAILERAVERSIEHAVFDGELGRRAFVGARGRRDGGRRLASVFPSAPRAPLAQDKPGPPEKKDLKVGFIPITCAERRSSWPEPMGFYKKARAHVQVTKASSWAMIRDLSINGETDATHTCSRRCRSRSRSAFGSQSVPTDAGRVEKHQRPGDHARHPASRP